MAMKKTNWLALCLTLLCGILIGASSATIYFEDVIEDLSRLPRHPPGPEELLLRLDNYCDLDEQQEKKVIAVLRAHKDQLDALRQRHNKDVTVIRKSLEKSLAPLLTPEQKEKVKAMLVPPPDSGAESAPPNAGASE